MGGVAFLPEELACAKEGLRVLELPADDRVPLVQFEREIAMGTDPFGVVGVHGSFGGGTDCNRLFEVGLTTEVKIRLDEGGDKVRTYARVTQATSGEKPSMWSFSRSRTLWETNMGK